MEKLSIKERVFYSLVCNEKRVYRNWYRRYLNAGMDLGRIRRVVARIKNWYEWCSDFNTFAFDGPGQGEMWKDMKFIPDYEKAVSTIIDWFEENDRYSIDLKRIGTLGWSLGGYLSPRAAAFDKRIRCAIGSGGPAHARYLSNKMKVNPILLKGIPHLVGAETYQESLELFDIDIKTAPPMDRPLLIFHSGKDKLISNGKDHADYFIGWAVGEKELKYYPDGTHVCANYLDETDAYMVDWLNKHLLN